MRKTIRVDSSPYCGDRACWICYTWFPRIFKRAVDNDKRYGYLEVSTRRLKDSLRVTIKELANGLTNDVRIDLEDWSYPVSVGKEFLTRLKERGFSVKVGTTLYIREKQ